jgi:DNA polymerase I
MPITGLSNAKMFTSKETIERMGIPPKLIPDFKGLVGDPSDNYKGVPGIGPKTAVNLLGEFGSFDGIYESLEKIPAKVRDKLEAGKESANISFKLAKIVTDVPIDFNFDDMKKWKIDSNNVLNLFEEYGFKTLTKRVKEVGELITAEKQERLF